jgi:hypothetical protein
MEGSVDVVQSVNADTHVFGVIANAIRDTLFEALQVLFNVTLLF